MADAETRFPPLYIVACFLIGVGIFGLGGLVVLQPPSPILSGLLYIFMGFLAFGIGETLNHPQISPPIIKPGDDPNKLPRQRNSCSLGNLCDIGAVLLFFVGLSALLFPQ